MNAKLILSTVVLLSVTACGGGGGGDAYGGGANTPPVQNQVSTGVWDSSYVITSGANSGNTVKAFLLVSPTGTFYEAGINQNSGCAAVAFGQSSVSGSAVSGTANSYVVTFSNTPGVSVNCVFPDGTTSASGTISGTVATAQSLVVTSDGKTSGGTALPSSTVSFTWSKLNSTAPSLSAVAGNYKSSFGSTITVNANGAISAIDPSTGCSLTGQVTIPSSNNNIYNVSYTYSNCSPSYASLNGVVATGLATYDNTVSPSQLLVGLNATVGGRVVVEAESLSKM